MSKILKNNLKNDEIQFNTINDDFDKNEKNLDKQFKSKRYNKSHGMTPTVEGTTTERKTFDILKESYQNESNETSVDIKTDFGEEKIEINNIYNFNCKNSAFDYILKNKISSSTSNIIQDSKSLNKEPSSVALLKTPIEDKKSEKSKKVIDMPPSVLENIEKNSENVNSNRSLSKIKINKISENNDTMKYIPDFSFDENNISNYKRILFKENLLFKNIEFEREYEKTTKTDLYKTNIIYKNKECILLLRYHYLYILEIKENKNEDQNKKNNKDNPDLSLLYQIQKKDTLTQLDEEMKNMYDISHPLLCINFNLLSCKLLLNQNNNPNNKEKKYEIIILILGSSNKFSFFFLDYTVYIKFIYIIGSKIKTSLGNKSNLLGLSIRTKDFYKDTYITSREFESMAETGDLLLFRTLECISDCQRLFTRDQYDHIVLIIKEHNMVQLLEATSSDNCNLLEWKKFKFNFFNLVFKKIVLRKLNIEAEKDKINDIRLEIQEKTKDFINKIYKKKYDMSILKMMFDRKPKDYEVKGEWDKAKGFCCSALNAAYYIYIGVMKLEKSVHCIRPGDFEQDRNRIIILPGYSFGPEKIIEFST